VKKCFAGLALLAAFAFSSCASMKNLFGTDYSVPVESLEVVQEKADRIITEKSYLKKFNDDVLYGYKFHNLMYYGPSLSALNDKPVYTLPDKIIGIQGYATPVANPNVAVSFIFARKLFAQSGYSSQYEASKINGVSFSAPYADDGYIDDFGRWHKYTYYDYFENIFKTRNQDVKLEMYQSIEIRS